MRTKGLIVFSVLISYALIIALFVFHEKNRLMRDFEEIQKTAGRVFGAFFTIKLAGKGTGLGLCLCYPIMKNHGGSIEIDSTPGQGTRVHVYFPINEIT